MTESLREPTSDEEWAIYHSIRRRVLFELRGLGHTYNANHPDERRVGHHAFLFWSGTVPVGVIRVDINGDTAIFRRVAIRDDVQRRGHGRSLLRAAEEFARSMGCTRIESHVDPGAVGFYERCGFVRPAPRANPGTTNLMTKPL